MIYVEFQTGMQVSKLIHPYGRTWDLAHIQSLFRDSLNEKMQGILIPLANSLDMRMWGSSCYLRVRAQDLYQLYREEPSWSIERAWI